MSVSTRKGDHGETSLAFNRRVPKTHPRVCAYGAVDELNAAIGVARAHLLADLDRDGPPDARGEPAGERPDGLAPRVRTAATLRDIQVTLQRLTGILAVADEDHDRIAPPYQPLADSDLTMLDALVAALETRLPPLRAFVIPGDNLRSAHLHHARTVCRRAERQILKLRDTGSHVDDINLRYLNRLSDVLFLLAREQSQG